MSEPNIHPEKITKPIQLLAAWLVGLIAIDGLFLLAADRITAASWIPGMLAVAAVINVPLFIVALFLLQTKFRPQMQEDSYYARYLAEERQYGLKFVPVSPAIAEQELTETVEKIASEVSAHTVDNGAIEAILRAHKIEILELKFAPSRALNELHVRPERWGLVVDTFSKNKAFIEDIERLTADGLVVKPGDYESVALTTLGREVAAKAESSGRLIHQSKPDLWKRFTEHLDKKSAGS